MCGAFRRSSAVPRAGGPGPGAPEQEGLGGVTPERAGPGGPTPMAGGVSGPPVRYLPLGPTEPLVPVAAWRTFAETRPRIGRTSCTSIEANT